MVDVTEFAIATNVPLREQVREYERRLVIAYLEETNGDVRKAASLADMAERTFHRKIQVFDIQANAYRDRTASRGISAIERQIEALILALGDLVGGGIGQVDFDIYQIAKDLHDRGLKASKPETTAEITRILIQPVQP